METTMVSTEKKKKKVPNFVNLDIIRTGRWWFAMVEDKSAANSGS